MKIVDLSQSELSINNISFTSEENTILGSLIQIMVVCNAFLSCLLLCVDFLYLQQDKKNLLNNFKMIFGILYILTLIFSIRRNRILQEKAYKDFKILQQNLINLNSKIIELNNSIQVL